MGKQESRTDRYFPRLAILVAGMALALPVTGFAQSKPDHSAHRSKTTQTAHADMPLQDQITELRAKVSQLETALQGKQMTSRAHSDGMRAKGDTGAMGGMMGMGGGDQTADTMAGMPGRSGKMGMMKEMMGGMGQMPGDGMPGMDRGMMGMAPGGGEDGMATPSALPGFPGASHLYHIGSTGFFLDHGEHITLSTEQQAALSAVKERALMEAANLQKKIDGAEQELWTLTASDQPDLEKIEAKVRGIEKLRADQRLALIRSVGDAAKLLSDEQRDSLLGQLPQQARQPAPTGGMGDM